MPFLKSRVQDLNTDMHPINVKVLMQWSVGSDGVYVT